MSSNNDLRVSEEATPVEENTIVFRIDEPQVEVLKVTPEGFYVRGKKVEQDDNEAQTVYNAFVDFLKESGSLKS